MKIFLIEGPDEYGNQIYADMIFSTKKIKSVVGDSQKIIKQTLTACIEESIESQFDYMVICSKKEIMARISEQSLKAFLEAATRLNCKILIFSAQRVNTLLAISDEFFWIDFFEDSDFFAVHESIYEELLTGLRSSEDRISEILSSATSNKLLLYPMFTIENEAAEKIELRKRMVRMIKKKKLLKSRGALDRRENRTDNI